MAGLPYMQFFTGDWLKDPALTICTPATRGVWIDLLCAMHECGRSGELCGTRDQLARLARCSTSELSQALAEIQTLNIAELHDRNGRVTVINRRMKREASARNTTRLRVERFRSNGAVTPKKPPRNGVDPESDPDPEPECEGRSYEPPRSTTPSQPAPSAPHAQVSEKPPEPTNKPALEQALAYFRKHSGCFREEEVRECYRTFEATQVQGFWYWGKRLVGDWRASMEQRMLDYREKRGGKKPPTDAKAALTRGIDRELRNLGIT